MKTLTNIFFALMLFVTGLNATNSISGTITDDQGNGIYYSTILLYSVEDSCIVKLATTDENGYYKIDDIENGDYYVAATILSHNSSFSENFSFPKKNNSKVNLSLEPIDIELPLIEVIGKRPQKNISVPKNDSIITNNITTIKIHHLDEIKRTMDEIQTKESNDIAHN